MSVSYEATSVLVRSTGYRRVSVCDKCGFRDVSPVVKVLTDLTEPNGACGKEPEGWITLTFDSERVHVCSFKCLYQYVQDRLNG